MLQINMADVMNVIGSLTPYLIAIGVLFALALIITFAVNKKTVKEVATRKIVHSESWLVALVGIVVAVSMMLTGPLSTLLNNATITKYMLSDTTVSKANELAKEVQSEAITMLKNDDSNLPLSNKKVNVFGWGSTNPVYGGTGSGSMSDQYETVSMLDGMKQAGIETNSELTKLYTDYRKDRPMVAMWSQDWTLPEVPADQYSDSLISDAKSFSDEAVVVLTRVGGEGADLPMNMKAEGITYENNSKDYEDFKDGESFLQLSQTERDMLDLVTKNFSKVTLVYNGANTFQFFTRNPRGGQAKAIDQADLDAFLALAAEHQFHILQTFKDTVGSFVEDQGPRLFLQCLKPRAAPHSLGRQETFENETVRRQASGGQGGDQRTCPRDRHHIDARSTRLAHQMVAWVANQRCACITN